MFNMQFRVGMYHFGDAIQLILADFHNGTDTYFST